ncbi:hypothetical protein [Microbacterium arborescens]|nr:hypothetical protein [Microbacterium arborescens]MDQ1218402.1 hypothetical protein [Microbacterium arborescens]
MSAAIATLRAELRDDTAFVATPTPRLSWTVRTDESDWMQRRAEIDDGSGPVALEHDESALVP